MVAMMAVGWRRRSDVGSNEGVVGSGARASERASERTSHKEVATWAWNEDTTLTPTQQQVSNKNKNN